ALLQAGPFGEQPRGLTLERLPNDEAVAHVLFGANAYACPNLRLALEEPVVLELLDGFRNREQTHAQLGSKAAPGQRRAQRQLAAQNQVANGVVGLFSKTG